MDNKRYDGKGNDSLMPDRWLHCPRTSNTFIGGKFLAFKTPLNFRFTSKMNPAYRFTPEMVFEYMKMEKKKLGFWIDLTNTKRFYYRDQITNRGIKYLKLNCSGHYEAPSIEQTRTFINLVDSFIEKNPEDFIGVHCTHGFNRTGFLIVAYMVKRMKCSLEDALMSFAYSRPPGIYKQDYIDELTRRYSKENKQFLAPERPKWNLEYDDGDGNDNGHDDNYSADQNSSMKRKHSNGSYSSDNDSDSPSDTIQTNKRRKLFINYDATFMAGVQGIKLVTDHERLGYLKAKIQKMSGCKIHGFPGSQPVSMDMNNIQYLGEKSYRVSWKADGTRYMMLILRENEIYFFDRNNACFQVFGMRFPCRDDLNTHLYNTLIDGEMVIDVVNGKHIPRYLVYDVVCCNGNSYMDFAFYSEELFSRLKCIKENIIDPRNEAIARGLINRMHEPFGVRDKAFWDITQAKKLLEPKFTKNLGHEPDGLIFQPSSDCYIPGPCPDVLKWKPLNMNSIDFKLKIVMEGGLGCVSKKVGHLYVGGLETPFQTIKLTKELRGLHNKIIECTFENGNWVYMRERVDKKYPNSYRTALAVCESIQNPVTTKILNDFIKWSQNQST